MQTAVIINTIIAVLGAVGGFFLAIASVISIANMDVPWAGILLVAAFGVPVAFVISGIGTWIAYNHHANPVAYGLMALPWLYGALFVIAMLLSFKQ